MPENIADRTFTNPVYPFSFADPFVLKYGGGYFAYCTGLAADNTAFGVLRSKDLVSWAEVGGAMDVLDHAPPFYWAPEVTYSQGKFYLYYSAGNEALMEIRVAVSDRPDGGFVDRGIRLTSQEFAIDPHVFTDTNGSRYMFYATDFLDHTRIGTGTVVERMIDWFTLEGNPRPVTRARYDWQIYDPARKEKGGVRWHTVEGPFVLKRKDIYYQMFSGGNWQNVSYGVSFAVTDDIDRDEEWEQYSEGEKMLPILRTLTDQVVGPGHNSVVRGPNNRELYCLYHRWAGNERVLAIDRMDFAGPRIYITGATNTPQLSPYKPAFTGFLGSLETTGSWEITETEATAMALGTNELLLSKLEPNYLLEVNISGSSPVAGTYGFYLSDDDGRILDLQLSDGWVQLKSEGYEEQSFRLPRDFLPTATQHLRIELDGLYLQLSLNETNLRIRRTLRRQPCQLAVTAESGTVFSGLAVTRGFEDLFDRTGAEGDHGWASFGGRDCFHVRNGAGILSSESDPVSITKGPHYKDYEFTATIRAIETTTEEYCFGFLILDDEIDPLRITIRHRHLFVGSEIFLLPDPFVPENYHQFRILIIDGTIYLRMEEHDLGSVLGPPGETRVAIFCEGASVAIETVRLTRL